MEAQLRAAEKERCLAWRLAAMPQYGARIPVAPFFVQHVTSVQLGILFKLQKIQQRTRSGPVK
jgi:hypothetical protein